MQNKKLEKFLASLSEESEFFGVLGTGYPNSFYKVYVRSKKTSKNWWKFEVGAGKTSLNPIKYQASLNVSSRAATVWAPIAYLPEYTYAPWKDSIGKLIERAKEIRAESRRFQGKE